VLQLAQIVADCQHEIIMNEIKCATIAWVKSSQNIARENLSSFLERGKQTDRERET